MTKEPEYERSQSTETVTLSAVPAHAGTNLTTRIGVGFAVLTLMFALVLGIVAMQVSNAPGLSVAISSQVRELILWWGFVAVVIAAVLGVTVSRKIAAPILELTADLQRIAFRHYPSQLVTERGYAELDQLSQTIVNLASSVLAGEGDLSASERKFREAFDLVGVGLAHIAVDGRFVMVNQRFCEMLGYSHDELVGMRFKEVVHPDDLDSLSSTGRFLASPDWSRKQEKRYVRKDGSVFWAHRSGVVVRDENGTPLYELGSIEDVSAYHATQDRLKALNASLNAIVETSPLAIYSLSPDGLVSLWNPAAEKMFGVTKVAALGQPSPLALQHDARDLASIHHALLTEGNAQTYESRHVGNNGVAIDVSISAAPLRGPDQEMIGILVICSDITEAKRTTRALGDQLRFIQELIEVIPNPIFYKDTQGRYLGFNLAWETFFGKRREDFIGKRVGDLLSSDMAVAVESRDQEVIRTGQMMIVEVQIANASGSLRQMLKHVSCYTNQEGKPLGTISLLTDITDFKQVEQALQVSEGRFQALMESAMDTVTVLDEEGIIRYQSSSARHLMGYTPAQMLGMNHLDIIHADDVELVRERFTELVSNGVMDKPVQFRIKAQSGDWRFVESIAKNCLSDPIVQGIIVNTRDITERRAIEERIQHLAYHDALTDLPNRLLMQDRISQAITRAERAEKKFAVMFIDIDNFKNINDTLGHDMGDELLREVAKRLREAVRSHDTIARQGGDEFIVLLDQLETFSGATRVAQDVLESLRAPFQVGGTYQHVSGSIGIALYPDDGSDAPTLLRSADTAMFHSKGLGKNTYQFFTQEMNLLVKRRAVMESNLRAAVKNGDFSLVYQPQVDLHTGEIVALEALVRWVSPENGIMMPGEFIHLAEETGLIHELGRWVLEESCRQQRRWIDMGFPQRRIAVNLSARQLMDKGFIGMLVEVLQETKIDPHYLELEITESQVMRQGENSVALLTAIAEMGIQLAIDDFGTGYSSLSYLKKLPISKLKIDQSFVRDITIDPNDAAIVVAIINMAKSLDLDIIAEGIEVMGQLAILRAKGCEVGQGFFFSVPLSAKDIEPILSCQTLLAQPQALAL